MNWEEFVSKAREGKKQKVTTGMQLSSISMLIYSGAFDSMIGGEPENKLATYSKMFEEIKGALKSTASLPKKTKVQPIGLNEVKNDMQLGLWRYVVNPMSKFDFLPYCIDKLKMRGFTELDPVRKEYGVDRHFPLFNTSETEAFPQITYLVKRFNSVFENDLPNGLNKKTTEMFENGSRTGAMVGVVTKKKKLPYGKEGKYRIIVDFYNGEESVKDLVIWPSWSTGKDPSFVKTMTKMAFGVIMFKSNIYRGRKGGNVVGWEKFYG